MLKMTGKIIFDPEPITKKHIRYVDYKYTTMVSFDDDTSDYYSWYLKKLYGLRLNKSIRGTHVTIINDRISDIIEKNNLTNDNDVKILWNDFKNKYHDTDITIYLPSIEYRTNDKYWWIKVPNESNPHILDIRNEINLGESYYDYHITIGFVDERNRNHSSYVKRLLMNKAF